MHRIRPVQKHQLSVEILPLPPGIRDVTRLELGGTVIGEHGIGAVKQQELSWRLGDATRAAQLAIKTALDPHHILTPGRALWSEEGLLRP